jgi:hypothetical protein
MISTISNCIIPMNKIFFLLLILFAISCAQRPIKKTIILKKIQKYKLTFEQMEKKRALESYRLMRLNTVKIRNKRKKKRKSKRSKSRIYKRSIVKKPIKVKPRTIKKILPSYPKRDPEKIMIEVNQNLSYFCMRHRKSRKFKTPEDCKAYTQEKLLECQTKHIEIDNARIVRCVKRRLKP